MKLATKAIAVSRTAETQGATARPRALVAAVAAVRADARLHEVAGYIALAKESLPAMNNAIVPPDQMLELSGLLDRMYRAAQALHHDGVKPAARALRAA